MLKNYCKAAWRNFVKNKAHAFINIFGLATGMAVTILIGLWIYDEISFNTYHQNYPRIAQVMHHETQQGEVNTYKAIPIPLATELRHTYKDDFKYLVLSSWTNPHLLSFGDKHLSCPGNFMEPEAVDMLSLRITKGSRSGLKDPSSILLSSTLSAAIFGSADPIGKILKLDTVNVTVTGVYETLPANTTFNNVGFIAPWELYASTESDVKADNDNWGANSYQLFAQLADHTSMEQVSAKIKNVIPGASEGDATRKSEVFLQPMSRWRLYQEFKNGVNTGGDIRYVWLFGMIGSFVLILACINFMNLSTARSEKRAKEVGVLKAIGALRGQLITQFFIESVWMTFVAFTVSLLLVLVALPFFNEIADKQITLPWSSPLFWLLSIGFILLTGLIAGSYPAFYLSAFRPVKVLKGTYRAGRFATTPRKILVVLQFTVSVVLIIGAIVVFRQIHFSKDRPVGYSHNGLLMIRPYSTDFHDHFDAMYKDLLQTGAITAMAESSSSITRGSRTSNGLNWQGKSPDRNASFSTVGVSMEYGKTVGWQFTAGRDFSKAFSTDASGIILNETAAKYMGLQHPIGEIISWEGKQYSVVGVIRDIIMESPYEPVKQAVYYWDNRPGHLNIKLNPALNTATALNAIETICKKYAPAYPVEYKFATDEFAKKFATEERVGKLASFLAILAIFISCLGLFGIATFMAEQRTKEIGIRKVFGASVLNIWRLLSKEFMMLVILAYLLAAPIAYYCLYQWLQHYTYRTTLSWWIFAITGAGALLLTLLTVSYQGFKAAISNPAKSLKVE
jgi:putative ABC transport system permease protein